jgi:raffinose/stachyose/melibiose transport system substrate-binding protein
MRREGVYMTRARKSLGLVVGTTALAVVAAGCGSSSDTGNDGDEVTLTVESALGGSTAILAAYEELNEQFESEHPGVTVEFKAKGFDEFNNTAKLQLSSDNPPDLTQVNRGYQAMGSFVKAGLLDPLDDLADEHGWADRQSEAQLELNRFSEDGVRMGDGPLWGMSATTAWIGLLMNTALADELGISAPPSTIAELEEQMQTAKEAGEIPFQFGSASGELAAWLLSELLIAEGGPEVVQDIVFHRDGENFKSDTARWAAGKMKEWGDAGYFTPDWTAYKTDQVMANFTSGEGLFALTSSRFMPLAGDPEVLDNVTMVAFPSVSGDELAAVAAGDIPWAIPSKSSNKDLAAEYVDFVTNADSAEVFAEHGAIPSYPPKDLESAITSAGLDPASADAIRNGVHLLETGTPVPYVDWGAPELYPVISSSFDLLMSGSMSPDAFLGAMQDAYEPFVESLEKG